MVAIRGAEYQHFRTTLSKPSLYVSLVGSAWLEGRSRTVQTFHGQLNNSAQVKVGCCVPKSSGTPLQRCFSPSFSCRRSRSAIFLLRFDKLVDSGMGPPHTPCESNVPPSPYPVYLPGEQGFALLKEPLISHHPWLTQRAPNAIRRVGLWGIFVILGGILLILATLFFIGFLWFSNDDNDMWRKIILAGWAPRSVTLASLVIRWACRWYAPASHTAPRTTGSRVLLVATLLTLTTILSQFTSTALLSDVCRASVTSDPQSSESSFAVNASMEDPIYSSWTQNVYTRSKPAFYPTSAEYSEEPFRSSNMYDTGLSLRAMIPIGDQNVRSALKTYSGFATVVDTRVVCVRPTFEIDFQFSMDPFLYVSGTVSTTQTGPKGRPFPSSYTAFFNCTTPLHSYWSGYHDVQPLTSLCLVDWWPGNQPAPFGNLDYWAWLVFSTTGSTESWMDEPWPVAQDGSDNEWATFKRPGSDTGLLRHFLDREKTYTVVYNPRDLSAYATNLLVGQSQFQVCSIVCYIRLKMCMDVSC